METHRWDTLKQLFSQALELAPEARSRFAASSCGSDSNLLMSLERLLQGDSVEDTFLEPLPEFEVDSVRDAVPERIAAYRIVRRISSGGMGDILLGVRADEQFEKRVAIKVLKRGLDTQGLLERFALERRTLASLEHPNIARLLDAGGLPDGRPYLVMEYVDGRPIDAFCEEEEIDIRGRLEIFLAVCGAVQSAHSRLVVHRDLKPANILVADDGSVKLLDFGVAKLLHSEDSLSTEPGSESPMTLGYASPEQIAGEPITTSTDVYSLGVILYRLLTGAVPLESDSQVELRRIVREELPELPSSRVRRGGHRSRLQVLRGDLDNIMMMALRKEPERRYSSANDLALDIRRYLSGFPVVSRPPTLLYRLGKFSKRNRVPLVAGVVVVLALITAVVVSVKQARAAVLARTQAESALEHAQEVTSFLQVMLKSANPAERGRDVRVRDVLDTASVQLGEQFEDRPLLEASLRTTLGKTYLALGALNESQRELERALALNERILGEAAPSSVAARIDLGGAQYAAGKHEQAIDGFERALDVRTELEGSDSPGVAQVLNDLAVATRSTGDYLAAASLHRRALAIRRQLGEGYELDVAQSLNNLSNCLRLQGELEQARAALLESSDIRRERLPLEHPLVVQSLSNLAVMEMSLGNLEVAKGILTQTIAIERASLGERHPDLATDLSNLASVHLLQAELVEAEVALRECVEIRQSLFEASDPVLGFTLVRHAELLIEFEQFAEAEAELLSALPAFDAESEPHSNGASRCFTALADLYARLGLFEQADWYRSLLSSEFSTED